MTTTVFGIPLWAELPAAGLGGLEGALFAAGLRERRIDVLGVVAIGVGVAGASWSRRPRLCGTLPGQRALRCPRWLRLSRHAS